MLMLQTNTSSSASVYSRLATTADLELLVKFINKAFARDNYFKRTERTNSQQMTGICKREIFSCSKSNASWLDWSMLSTSRPSRLHRPAYRQFSQTGPRHWQAAHEVCRGFLRDHGCSIAEIDVINLRPELVDWYRGQAYQVVGEAPYPRPEILIQPCHFIAMQKSLPALKG